MSELLPCPFCGGAARDAEPHNKRCSPRIECSKCYIGISAMNCESERSEAVDAWNTRAQHLPSEDVYTVPAEHSAKGTVNFCVQPSGAMTRIEPSKNAVVIQVFDELRDAEGNLKTVTHVECKDMSLKDELLQIARNAINPREKS